MNGEVNSDVGMGDDDVNIDVSVVVIDVNVIVMSDFDVDEGRQCERCDE